MDTDAVQEISNRLGAHGGASANGLIFGMSMWGIIASLVFSGIGYYYFKRGRDQSDTIKIGCGIAMMFYPYFVTNAFYIVLLGVALMAAPSIIEKF